MDVNVVLLVLSIVASCIGAALEVLSQRSGWLLVGHWWSLLFGSLYFVAVTCLLAGVVGFVIDGLREAP